MHTDPNQDKAMYIIGWIFVGLLCVAGILYYCFPGFLKNVMPPCVFFTLTGYYCPGCGITRSIYALLEGNLIKSGYYHPFVPYTAILGGWFMLSQTIQRLSKDRIKIGLHFRPIYAYIAIALIFANCIIKDILHFAIGYQMI